MNATKEWMLALVLMMGALISSFVGILFSAGTSRIVFIVLAAFTLIATVMLYTAFKRYDDTRMDLDSVDCFRMVSAGADLPSEPVHGKKPKM